MYLYEMGNAVAYAAGADMLPREMASNIRHSTDTKCPDVLGSARGIEQDAEAFIFGVSIPVLGVKRKKAEKEGVQRV